jgi:hypothetical protein
MNKLNVNSYGNGSIMPLLMGFTPSTKIQEVESLPTFVYDDEKQIVSFDMRIVGTKSLKVSSTNYKPGLFRSDKKNEIDDQKNA